MKYLLITALSLILSSGCLMTKMLIPDVETRMSQKELTHKALVATKTQDELSKLLIAGGLENDKAKLTAAKLIYKAGVNADDIAPSAAENIMQQYMIGKGQAVLDVQLDAGFQWTKGLIGQIAGGATGTGTIATLLIGYLRKKKALGIVSAELNPEEKGRVKGAMNHTGLEKQLT